MILQLRLSVVGGRSLRLVPDVDVARRGVGTRQMREGNDGLCLQPARAAPLLLAQLSPLQRTIRVVRPSLSSLLPDEPLLQPYRAFVEGDSTHCSVDDVGGGRSGGWRMSLQSSVAHGRTAEIARRAFTFLRGGE